MRAWMATIATICVPVKNPDKGSDRSDIENEVGGEGTNYPYDQHDEYSDDLCRKTLKVTLGEYNASIH
jgi:hypothetical protein